MLLPTGSLAFAGSRAGEIVSCNGNQGGAWTVNTDNALVYYDFASGQLIPILDGENPEVGHIDDLALIGSDLFLLDSAITGSLDDLTGAGQGAILRNLTLRLPPEPGTWALSLAGIALLILRRRQAAPNATANTWQNRYITLVETATWPPTRMEGAQFHH